MGRLLYAAYSPLPHLIVSHSPLVSRFARGLFIALMETASTSETSVQFNVTTRRYIPEDSKLHTRRRENLKSHIVTMHFVLMGFLCFSAIIFLNSVNEFILVMVKCGVLFEVRTEFLNVI
jgi:hypothetical protein